MSWWKHSPRDFGQAYQDANDAWAQAVEERKEIEELRPQVEQTVRAHLELQRQNHFAERLRAAYRGEAIL